MRAAFTARQAHAQGQDSGQELSHPGHRALLLAESTAALFHAQLSHFSPALRTSLPEVSSVAAQQLHELFSADFLPWLGTGERIPSLSLQLGALFHAQLAHSSPALRASLPEVSSVAAQQLRQLFSADFLPWLGTGAPQHMKLKLAAWSPVPRAAVPLSPVL